MILLNPPGSFPGVIPNYFFRKTPKGGPAGRPWDLPLSPLFYHSFGPR